MGVTHHDGLSVNNSVANTATVGTVSAGNVRLTNSANRGLRTIATGGSGVVTTTSVDANSVIILTPVISTTGYYTKASARVKTLTAGASFKIMLTTGAGTAATGVVRWAIINSA